MKKNYRTECLDNSEAGMEIQRMLIISLLSVVWFVFHTVDCSCTSGSHDVHRFGPKCVFMCHCKNNEKCNDTTGDCASGCAKMWYGPGCQYRDIAEGKFTRHSDNLVYSERMKAQKANDGDPDTCSFTAETNSTKKQIIPFWRVWLPTKRRISELVILTQVEKLDYFKGFTVYVENVPENQKKNKTYSPPDREECYKHVDNAPKNTTIKVLCKNPVEGNQVRIELEELRSQLVLCDVRINWVCEPGLFGEDCSQNCSQNCEGGFEMCSNIDGICKNGCTAGWMERNCNKECDDGQYGKDCNEICSPNCEKNDTCRKVDGQCPNGCKPGYSGSQCNEMCDDGKYGKDCNETCSLNCKMNETCKKEDGRCPNGCKPGYSGSQCNEKCKPGLFGENCSQNCSQHCEGGFEMCNNIDGECQNGCTAGWMENTCDKVCDDGRYGKDCNETCSLNCIMNETCKKEDGQCPDGCKPGYSGSQCNQMCDDGKYGKGCNETCSPNCKGNETCEKVDGQCLTGCKPGYIGGQCNQKCARGLFGENCTQSCSQHCEGGFEMCSNIDGKCQKGCTAGWMEQNCNKKCDDGRYGKECNKTCSPNCKRNETCIKETGRCPNGCKPGYSGKRCNQMCDDGKYGIGCNETCSPNCKGNETCEKVDGQCLTGCKPGYIGGQCNQKCARGLFGENCTQSCSQHCEGGFEMCSNIDGKCQKGCTAGWMEQNCNKTCKPGLYGEDCSQNCNQHCEGGFKMCSHIDGICQMGCKAGWVEQKCDKVCDEGKYGKGCNETCSPNCKRNETCNKVDGQCPNGCKSGYVGDKCNQTCGKGQFGEDCAQNCTEHCKGGFDMCNSIDGACQNGCKDGWIDRNCDKDCEDGFYGTNCSMPCGYCKNTTSCDKVSGFCIEGCDIGYQGANCLEALQQSVLTYASTIGIVTGISVLLVTIVVIVALSSVRRKQRKEENRKSLDHGQVQNTTERSGKTGAASSQEITPGEPTEYANAVPTDASQTSKNTIPISSLVEHVKENNRHILDEFKALPFGMIHPSTIGMKPFNRGKNRYKDMKAYDHSRVVLTKRTGEQGSDYINASLIKGYSKGIAYIAAQGPIETSIDDFWRMIWEKNVHTIVMLTNLVEEQKKKCLQYWPSEESIKYSGYIVFLVSEASYAEFTIRNLTVSFEGKPQRNVCQFHFKAWPDKGLPRSPSSLLQFWRKVRSMSTQRPWLVHCSAGVGRTGTFIATDILYDQVKAEGCVDVFTCVRDLRDQRTNMVQTKDQYKFLFVLMIECFVLPSEPVSLDNIHRMMNDLKTVDSTSRKTKLLLQYEALNEDMPYLTTFDESEDRYSAAKLADNTNKNRFSDVIPQNEFRPFLITNIPNCTNYINAVFMPSYCETNSFILTQIPLENTAIDCCRLVYEKEIKVIVTFEDAVKGKVGIYLPEKDSITLGPFKVVKNSEEDKEFYNKKTYTMSFESEERAITELVFKAWPKSHIVPKDAVTMLSFIQQVESNKRASGNKPVIVQCLNGAEKSGLIAVLVNILERARLEEEVSIPQVIRQLRVRREQIIPNFEQFQFCYDMLLNYVDRETTYANM